VTFLGELHGAACDLYLHRQGLDTSTPAGRALFGMLGIFSEFERALIVERTMVGLARARANGKALGRPKVAGGVEAAVLSSLAAGTGIVRTAREIGRGVGTVQRIRREAYHDPGSRDTHPTPTARWIAELDDSLIECACEWTNVDLHGLKHYRVRRPKSVRLMRVK
jgi:DNA invertase Pin-like site-specific DNA recombinase